MKACVYMRVSTDQQDLASQEHAIKVWLAARPDATAQYFCDAGISGKSMTNRPALKQMLQAVAAGEFDTVVCFRLDRLSRNAAAAMQMLMTWMQEGISFYAIDQPILQLGKENPLRLTIIALMAEVSQIERDAIVSRVRAGLAAAKARGVRLGGVPKLGTEQVEQLRQRRATGTGYRELAREYGVGVATVHKACRGIA